jgi:hypothetical protein|tara:strand:- start:67 stop:267 length:201 start_codon:yes stop_codon:yes gene_type:complete
LQIKTLLDEAIDAWSDARQGVIAEARNIPPIAFGYRPAKECHHAQIALYARMQGRTPALTRLIEGG